MSNNEALSTIEHSDLSKVHGGYTVDGEGSITLPGGSGTVKGKYSQSGYETCLDRVREGANEKYPDNRWFWQRWMGQADPNAGPRADYMMDKMGRCGAPS